MQIEIEKGFGLDHISTVEEVCEQIITILNLTAESYLSNISDDDLHYQILRNKLIEQEALKSYLPKLLIQNNSLNSIKTFFQNKYKDYHTPQKQEFIKNDFERIKNYLINKAPMNEGLLDKLSDFDKKFDSKDVHQYWKDALDSIERNNLGNAFTLSRTMIEGVCKRVLNAKGKNTDSAKSLTSLSAEVISTLETGQFNQVNPIRKKTLKLLSNSVDAIETFRTQYGDAHDLNNKNIELEQHFARVTINIAGSASLFLVEEYLNQE
ncbi:hypothetical protein MED121_09278 [Marinomonas sp. MED121]|uniref:abortive infection family protein n=1 Tax=Marinomonas sp. MED121 TaxID=314277 RepID=UPI00006900F9|nr:abortive infection family protein [Marinomonas sp. MED121]EAQ65746.1 hypothetical protein MED121_09278 [Marinomonas sp. MED121]